MKLEDRIAVLAKLGDEISQFLASPETHEWYNKMIKAKVQNQWFAVNDVLEAFKGIHQFLNTADLENWVKGYNIGQVSPKRVGVIMAGNIPMVGFHDLLCVFISGHNFVGKLSSDDNILIPALVKKMVELDERVAPLISFAEQLKDNIDAVIATGSNNTARYFEYYFGKYPNIIRKNRSSVAVLSGKETKEELHQLGFDIFQYYGLGCRNVSKLFLPKGYNIDTFYEGIFGHGKVIDHNKYNNNYTYNRTIFLMQDEQFFDNNFLLLKENTAFSSPIGSLYFEVYNEVGKVKQRLLEEDVNIQCVVSIIEGLHSRQVGFGEAQQPALKDYADGVDTLGFLVAL